MPSSSETGPRVATVQNASSQSVQRIVFPTDDVDAVSQLYLESGGTPQGRTECLIPAGTTLRLGTYFNAFPAAYWRRWTASPAVLLSVDLTAEARCVVWRSDATGAAHAVAEVSGTHCEIELALDESFDRGGYYWLEVTATEPTTLREGVWSVVAATTTATTSIGITTFNRPTYCLEQLRRISNESALLSVVDHIYVVDQGNDLVSDQPGFAEVAQVLADRLVMIRQANLGGSGGFSRAMLETVDAGKSQYVLLLDDDAISEPEAIVRAVKFAEVAAARQPVLVGGGMLRLDRREVLFVQGEMINLAQGRPSVLPGLNYNHDFTTDPLPGSPALHPRHDAGYNAWWMCLIPVTALAEIGLGLPYFIKWDDMEFGLRAARAGYPTVSLPGVAVWHQAWDDKFSWRSWEEYFAERNMWLSMLAHQESPRSVPLRAFLVDVGMILSLQYSSAALRVKARSDVQDGLVDLHDCLATRLSEVRAFRAPYPDADKRPSADDFPAVQNLPLPSGASQELEIRTTSDVLTAAKVGLKHLFVPVPKKALAAPQVELGGRQAIWRQFATIDSALVRYPDGYVWLRRDQRLTWRLLWQSATSVVRLALGWRRRHRRLRDELPLAVAPQQWRQTFSA